MFIGHLPGGYLATRAIWRDAPRSIMIAGLIGSVAPDLDLLLFYFVDGRAFHLHEYLTHRPVLWAVILLISLAIHRQALTAFAAGGLVHMGLDSIAGSIAWAWPFSHAATPLVVVPATKSHWILSFLTHWTFAVEICLSLVAATVAWRANRLKTQ